MTVPCDCSVRWLAETVEECSHAVTVTVDNKPCYTDSWGTALNVIDAYYPDCISSFAFSSCTLPPFSSYFPSPLSLLPTSSFPSSPPPLSPSPPSPLSSFPSSSFSITSSFPSPPLLLLFPLLLPLFSCSSFSSSLPLLFLRLLALLLNFSALISFYGFARLTHCH
jgi:hypothetical protein